MQIIAVAITVLFTFIAIQYLVVRLIARRDGFKRITYNLNELGPILLSSRWDSVRIGPSLWGRNITVTLFTDYIHLKLMRFFGGGGEMLLPLHNAEYKFSRWVRGEFVEITIDQKKYLFSSKISKILKQYYA